MMRARPTFRWLWTHLLVLAWTLLAGVYLLFRMKSMWVLLIAIVAVAAYVAIVVAFRRFPAIHTPSLIVATGALAWLLLVDAPPVENPYTVNDVLATNEAVLASYDAMMAFEFKDGIKVTASVYATASEIFSNSAARADEIRSTWDGMLDARTAIERFDAYPGVVDLKPGVPLNFSTPVPSYVTLRQVCFGYSSFASLQFAEGQPEDAARTLALFNRITRKTLPHQVLLVSKMIWVAIAGRNIETASAMVFHTNATPACLDILAEAFPPIPEEDASLRLAIIAEHLGQSDMAANIMTSAARDDIMSLRMNRTLAAVLYACTFKKNRTIQASRAQCDLLLAGIARHPPDIADAKVHLDRYFAGPDVRNLTGWALLSVSIPSFSNAVAKTTLLQVRSDLLALEIANRQGRALELKDFYGSEPYRRDQTGRVFSVGPDGQPGTTDDVAL